MYCFSSLGDLLGICSCILIGGISGLIKSPGGGGGKGEGEQVRGKRDYEYRYKNCCFVLIFRMVFFEKGENKRCWNILTSEGKYKR